MAIFTARVARAIARALEAHADPTRTGEPPTASAVHAVTVALILSRYTDDEEIIIAGLLLDALEPSPSLAQALERDFGPRVLQMVQDVAEPLRELPWSTRTARYLRRLSSAPNGSLLIAGADMIARLIALLGAAGPPGQASGPPPARPVEEPLRFARAVYEVVRGSWPRCPLLREFKNRLEEAERKLLRGA